MENKTVLVVDDESIVCRALERDLKEAGYVVSAVGTGQEAIEQCKQNQYSLVFVDYILPDTNGVDLCASIKNLCPDTELVFMTGCVDENVMDAEMKFCDAGGKNYYLYKPFHEGEIVSIANKILRDK